MPSPAARRAERSGAVGARVVLALLVHHAHVRRQVARLAERSGAVGARVVLALLVHRAHVQITLARTVVKVLSQREQACARLRALVSFTMVCPGRLRPHRRLSYLAK